MGDTASTAINVTLSGLAIVFGTLIGLVFVIWAFGKIMDLTKGAGKKKAAKPAATAPATAPAAAPVAAPAPVAQAAAAEDEEVIAGISAAVASMYEGTGKTPVIRVVRPVCAGARPIWSAAGLVQNTKSF